MARVKSHSILRITAGVAAGIGATLLYMWKRKAAKKKQKLLGGRSRSSARILVTGFHDWEGLDNPPNVWKICKNPSARLLVGDACDAPPSEKKGPLAKVLRKLERSTRAGWEFSFQTLPTTWRSSWCLDRSFFDVVIHLGLGVYDCVDKILVEDGAINKRANLKDAAGNLPPAGMLDEKGPNVLEASPRQRRAIADIDGRTVSGGGNSDTPPLFTVQRVAARPENSYICNETHWSGLLDVQRGKGRRPAAVFFVHIPFPKVNEDYEPLATAVAAVIDELSGSVLERA